MHIKINDFNMGRFLPNFIKKICFPLPKGIVTHEKPCNLDFPFDIQTQKHGSTVNLDTLRQIIMIRPRTFVDVGPGDGFYGKLVKRFFPICYATAIEKNKVYLDKFNLASIYDKVIHDDITEAIEKIDNVELMIFGDILEHLEKGLSTKVLKKGIEKSSFIIVNSPLGFQPQQHEYKEEIHRSGLDYSDFESYKVLEYKEFDKVKFNCLLLGKNAPDKF